MKNKNKELSDSLYTKFAAGRLVILKLKIVYRHGDHPKGKPVYIKLFSTASKDIRFTFPDEKGLIFSNENGILGDAVEVDNISTEGIFSADRMTMKDIYSFISERPFVIDFIRIRSQTAAQLESPIRFISEGQEDGNSIIPDDYLDPNQYDPFTVDVPINYEVSDKKGFAWTIDDKQDDKGLMMNLFIGTDPFKNIKSQ